jgi:protein gp37
MNPEWARDLRVQCVDANVAFFFKQWGEYSATGTKVGKKAAGRLLDGREWSEFPRVVDL